MARRVTTPSVSSYLAFPPLPHGRFGAIEAPLGERCQKATSPFGIRYAVFASKNRNPQYLRPQK